MHTAACTTSGAQQGVLGLCVWAVTCKLVGQEPEPPDGPCRATGHWVHVRWSVVTFVQLSWEKGITASAASKEGGLVHRLGRLPTEEFKTHTS
jgi:hypothetical protein